VAKAQEADLSGSVLEDVIVVNAATNTPADADNLQPPRQIALPADSTAIAARTPGGGAIGNGMLSGQLSYRGLFGERVLGTVNGQRFVSGGPNAMDPPMHYAPSILIDRIEIARGVAPVSDGPSLAGAVNAELRQVHFDSGNGTKVQAGAAVQYRSIDQSYAIGAIAGAAGNSWRIGVIASREEGEDYDFEGGTATGTSFERNLYGVHAGLKLGDGELFAEYRRSEADPSGNPAFAMDIVYVDTDFVQGGYRGQLADDIGLEVRVGHVAVRHLMDNQTLRQPAAPAMMARATFADADSFTADAQLQFGSHNRHVKLGVDMEVTDKFVRITNPWNASFFLDAQPNLGAERYGAFAQWRGGLGMAEFELGARLDHVSQNAGVPQLGSAVPMGPRNLAAAYTSGLREADDVVGDIVLRTWLPGDGIIPRLTLARKTRVPSLLERFAWLPTQASYGLADGNIYVGNPSLKPEIAWIAEAGADLELGSFTLRPTLFYRRVDDYIQGTPFDASVGVIDSPVEMIANMNGDATPFMFRNVDAELYGLDFDFSAELGDHVLLEGTASYVRGKRRDIADNLYRVPPANMRVSASWQGDGWALGAEIVAAAAQNDVSASNDESTSDGYGVVGLFGQWQAAPGITFAAGIENLFDTFYQPHLAGRSRVGASDVPLGERLPGGARGVWLRVNAGF